MTKLSLAIVLAFASIACGGQTFDVGADDASTDSARVDTGTTDAPGSDTSPFPDAGPDTPPPPDWYACTQPTDCLIAPASCCGMCGVATATDVVSLNRIHASEYRSSVCGPGTGCPDCAGRNDPNLQSICPAGRCQVLDIATDAVSVCESDADCQLRTAGCCDPCGTISPSDLVAFDHAQLGTYLAETCGGTIDCPACVPAPYPAGYAAKCDPSTHHCAVVGPK